jgi:UDP-2,3-diacylglucosamine pyrophosphatase LpxH
VFFGKDRHLMALCATVEREDGLLVIGGDAMDFHQAWSFTRILRAHQELLSSLSRLARANRLFYVIGNHDYDISFYREILGFPVCDELHIGDEILVMHGHEHDPFIQKELDSGQLSTKVHHFIERYLDTWIRIPLGEFYTLPNRLAAWLMHKFALFATIWVQLARAVGWDDPSDKLKVQLDFWARSNMGDPMCIFRPITQRVRDSQWKAIVCGHSHLPGLVNVDDRLYCNTGSWTFASSHFLTYDAGEWHCRDWITGREFGDHFYRPLLDGTIDEKDFWQWWRENYMGFLRFREGEERRGRLRGWESYIRDSQYLAQIGEPLRPLELAVASDDEASEIIAG